MDRYHQAVLNFLRDEDGPTSTEYAILLALGIVFCVSSVSSISHKQTKAFNTVANTLGNVSGS
jgi:pilus assembly protein Flp/PilA